ncbi:class I adenylate-forming enzyme family protein [Sphingomonas sp. 1P06PA]|uniref:class I adenylate-forming enzyme family protein n=1 Tax=Sphingomonas sp. 1P06PA TaxID=554121 RepID=UPI0039A773AD
MGRLLTLHDPAEASRYYAAGLWRQDTLYSLAARWASERGGAFALRDAKCRLTWRELVADADRIAAALHDAGLQPGDRVSVWMGNRAEAVAIFLACSRNGYVFNTSLHATYTCAEVATLLDRVACRALFAQVGHGADSGRNSIFTLAAGLSSMRAVFALGDEPRPAGTCAYPAGDTGDLPPVAADPDKIVYLAFTSGTTGLPKGVMHSDNSLLANARAMVADWGHDGDTVLLTLSQMSHHIGTVALDQALVGGFELVLSDPAAGVHPIDWIAETGATYVMGVPTHAIDILAALRQRGLDRLGQVRTFYMAGAPIPKATAQAMLSMGITPQNVYGMTENGSHQYTLPSDAIDTITGTCGRACAAYQVRLFDPEDRDREVPAGEIGEIGGRGAMRMLGYFANQQATETSFNAGGWFMSGDLGRIDTNGDLEIVGRSKDMIIRGGHNIHPAHIEDLAVRHAAVLKAAAIAVPDERLGERVCLVVIAAGDAVPEGADLLGHLDACGLSKFDMPEYFAVVDALPLGPTGKVLKRELIEQLRAGALVPQPVRWRAAERAA